MVDIKKLAQQAEKRKTIWPKLEFSPDGDKLAEGHAIVTFQGNPTQVNNPKAAPGTPNEFLVAIVQLEQPSDFGQMPGTYQLVFAAANTALTDGILNAMSRHKNDLMGVRCDIEAYTYVHPKHGKTRGYRVNSLGRFDTQGNRIE